MTVLIAIILMVVAAAFVAVPFVRPEPALGGAVTPAGREERRRFERQKADAYAAIKEAEFDHQMGKLSAADFGALRQRYMGRALEALAALEGAAVAKPRQLPVPGRPTRIAFCPACGHGVPPRANFCPACGRLLKEEPESRKRKAES